MTMQSISFIIITFRKLVDDGENDDDNDADENDDDENDDDENENGLDAAAAREERVSAKPGIVLTHVNVNHHHDHDHDRHHDYDYDDDEEKDDEDDEDVEDDMLVARMRLSPWVSTCLVYVGPSCHPPRSGC